MAWIISMFVWPEASQIDSERPGLTTSICLGLMLP